MAAKIIDIGEYRMQQADEQQRTKPPNIKDPFMNWIIETTHDTTTRTANEQKG